MEAKNSSNNTPAPKSKESRSWFYEFCRAFVIFWFIPLFRLEAHGRENVPRTGGHLLVGNHASFLDPPLLGAYLPRQLHYLAKSDLFKVPFLGWLIGNLNAHPIRRGASDRQALRIIKSILQDGHMLVAFPEGTRSPDGSLREPKAGVAMMAVTAGVPCVPAYVHNSFRAWPRHRKLPRPCKVHVYYGKAFDMPQRPEGATAKEYYRICGEEIMRRIADLKQHAIEQEQRGQNGLAGPSDAPSEADRETVRTEQGE